MSSEITLASNALAARIGVEKGHMLATIKAQCFKCDPEKVSDTQLAAFVSIAHDMGVNPLLPGMLYAFPDGRGGIVPMMGPDGVMKKLAELKGVTYECIVYPEDVTQPPTHATAKIYVEGKERPYTYTAVYSEWATPNWTKKPRHWNWLRALKQCARQVIHGLPMDEEEMTLGGMMNVTPGADIPAPAPERPKVSRRGGAAAAAASEATVTTPAAESEKPATSPKPGAAPTVDAEIVNEEPETEAAREHRQQQERRLAAQAESAAKAEREATEKALKEREAKAKAAADAKAKENAAKPTTPAPDTSKVPEVAPGISIDGFMGKSYPVTLTGTIKTLTPKASSATPYAEMSIETPQGTLPFITFEGVKKTADGFEFTDPALRVDALIEFNVEAKLRKSKEKGPDNKPLPDLTKPPALIASAIKDADEVPV